jgi:hypothetical protein
MFKKSQCNMSLLLGFSFFSFVWGWNSNQLRAQEIPSSNEVGTQLNLGQWPYNFTQEQKTQLQSIGFTYSQDDLGVALRLSSRGFSAEEYVYAYVETSRIKPREEKQYAEAMAVFIYSGLPVSEFSAYLSLGYSVTDYYNSRIGGTGRIVAGWVLFGNGLGSVVTGALYLALAAEQEDTGYHYYGDSDSNKVVGYTLIGIGGALVLVGLPLAISGHVTKSHRAPSDVLDSGNKTDMQPYRLSDSGAEESTSATRHKWALAPYYSKDKNWGLAFALNF